MPRSPLARAATSLGPPLAVAAAYVLTGMLGLLLAIPPGLATPVWIPSGVALAGLLRWGPRAAPGIWVGSFLVNGEIVFDPATPAAAATSLSVMTAIATGSTLQSLLALSLIRRLIGPRNPLDRVRDVLVLLVVVLASCLVAATFGALTLALAGLISWSSIGTTWTTWWLGDAVGILVFAPIPSALAAWRHTRWKALLTAEAALHVLLLLTTGALLLGGLLSISAARLPIAYSMSMVPFVVWAAIRFGSCGTVLTVVLIWAVAVGGTLQGWGAFAREDIQLALLLLQADIGTVAAIGLVLAAALTERRRGELALHEGREESRQIVESAPNGLVVVDLLGHIVLVNNQAEKLFGYTRQELIGQPVEMLIPHRFRGRHPMFRAGFHADPQTRPMGAGRDLFGLRKDGSEVAIEIGLNPLTTARGAQTLASIVDITDRKRADAALRESEARHRAILETAVDAILTIDERGVVESANPATERLFGYAANELIGRNVNILMPAPYHQAHDGYLEHYRRTGERRIIGIGREVVGKRKDGSTFPMSLSVSELTVGDRRIFTGIVHDLTQVKKAEDQLKALNESLEQRVTERTAEAEHRAGQLQTLAAELTRVEQRERRRLAQILHDHLQQLLVAARMRIDTLGPETFTEVGRRDVQDVGDLLGQSIEVSRSLTTDLSPPVLYDAGLAPALAWLSRWMRDKHRLEVEVLIISAAEPANEDLRAFLFQSTREMLFNVVKHAGVTKALVRLSLVEEDKVQIEVEDHGRGFDPSEPGLQRKATGGLGLFSIRERARLLGGRLEMESRPGRGTRVRLVLPLGRMKNGLREARATHAPPTLPPPAPDADSSVEPGRIRVVLVDDHKIVREGLATLLASLPDIEIVGQAEDGQAALDLTRRIRPDVVVMDITMPRINGIEATRILKIEQPDLRIIGLSMHEREDVADAMLGAGAAVYLRKDGPAKVLIGAIREGRGRLQGAV